MPEAEISPAGEVLVEGHHVGEMQGFRFTADKTAEGEDARAVKAAAQKALAAEFEARADRFAAAPNGDLAIGSDGVLRWVGAPVASLTGSDDVLKPRLVLLADEQLTGPARDKVGARAERFVNYQVETLLKPLVDLRQADTLSGMARGLAFQLTENFGLLNRRDVAEEVRALEQDARAALRRFGVRFGAYHIFVPALIKPAPAGFATLLWALKNDAKDKPGYGDVVEALAAGRTSIATDPSFERAFYRLAGFRNLGRRAVRVDILERLADLIRPALAWKPGENTRPEGAFGDNAFVVTPAMMSILGATADDMESILKSLGYRAESKTAEEVSAKLASLDGNKPDGEAREPASGEAATGSGSVQSNKGAESPAPEDGGADSAEKPEAIDAADSGNAESGASGDVSAGTESLATDQGLAQPIDVDEPQAAETGGRKADGAAEAQGEEEEKPVLIWRQARFERRRPPHRRAKQDGGRKAETKPGAHHKTGEERQKGPRPKKKDRKPGGAPPREKQRQEVDPDSPFAKLAALKNQLSK